MKIVTLSLVIVAVFIQVTFGSSVKPQPARFIAPIKSEIQYGKTIKYCEYEGMKLFLGSKFRRLDVCMKCQCIKYGLECQEMYVHPGVFVPYCRHVSMGCKGRWVMKDNQNKKCPKKLTPD